MDNFSYSYTRPHFELGAYLWFFITEIEISDTLISDHNPIIFNMSLPNLFYSPTNAETFARHFPSQFQVNFNMLFNELSSQMSLDSSFPDLDVDQHLELLKDSWLEVLNETAPLKVFKQKTRTDRWHTPETRTLRQACRKAERKWKKDRLQSSSKLLKDCLLAYQLAAKAAKAAFFFEHNFQ